MNQVREGRFQYLGRVFFVLVLAFVLAGCGSDDPKEKPGESKNDTGLVDTGVEKDSDGVRDAEVKTDTEVEIDSGGATDAEVKSDAETELDADPESDAELESDAEETDDTSETKCTDEDRAVGDRYPAGDGCNYCVCNEDGSTSCTERVCVDSRSGCEHDGAVLEFGERFDSADECNECMCGPSGIACTQRKSCGDAPPEESAILLESLDEQCGSHGTFTARSMFEGLPRKEITAPFKYVPVSFYFPEMVGGELDDTTVSIRLDPEESFAICRLESSSSSAIDIGLVVELKTADGEFDEGFPAYLRRSYPPKFVDAWSMNATVPYGGLNGSFVPRCRPSGNDPGPYLFNLRIDADGSTSGDIGRVCEVDMALSVGTFELPEL